MDRIDIKIKDNKEFGDVAFLVDKCAFLDAVENLRKKWNIKYLLPLNKFKDWQQNLYDESTKRLEDFEVDVRDLRIRSNKPETFDKAIAYSVVCGIIPDGIYKSTYWSVDPLVSPPLRLQSRTSRVAIFVTPQSVEEEVMKALSEIKGKYFKNTKSGYDPFFILYHKRGESTIERDRDWYWRNLKGESPLQISVVANKGQKYRKDALRAIKIHPHKNEYDVYMRNIDSYKKMVEQATRRYKRALTYT